MSDISVEQLRTLIRFVAPLRTLVKDVQRSLHMDTFRGTSKLITKNYNSLHKTIANILADDYAQSLALEIDDNATEREIISQVSLAASQLLAHLESVTGTPQTNTGTTQIQTAPQIIINASGTSDDNVKRIMGVVEDAMEDEIDD